MLAFGLVGLGLFLGFGNLRLGRIAVTGRRSMAQDGLFESRESHTGGVAIGDFLFEDGIVCNLMPVDLLYDQPWMVRQVHTATLAEHLHP